MIPIGDHFTMGPREAAVALELLGVVRCVPCHYGTFPLLTGTPEKLRELAPTGVEILSPEPGETLTLTDARALVRGHGAEGARRSSSRGRSTSRARSCSTTSPTSRRSTPRTCRATPVVVRAATVEEVHAALSLGEVACALVRDPALVELDLPQLTYG